MDTREYLQTMKLRLLLLLLAALQLPVCTSDFGDLPFFQIEFQGEKGWLLGPRSFRTLDGGKTWEPWMSFSIGDDYDPLLLTPKLQILDDKFGFLSHEGRLNRTSDGGLTWRRVYDQPIYGFWFRDSTFGFAHGKDGRLYRTEDGGENWNLVPDHIFYSIRFSEDGSAYAAAGRVLYRLIHGAVAWDEAARVRAAVWAVERDGDQLWLVGDQGLCLKYSLKTENLEDYSLPKPVELHDIAVGDGFKVAVGRSGSVFVSALEDRNWRSVELAKGISLASAAFAPDGTVFVAGGAEKPIFSPFSWTGPRRFAAMSTDMVRWRPVPLP